MPKLINAMYPREKGYLPDRAVLTSILVVAALSGLWVSGQILDVEISAVVATISVIALALFIFAWAYFLLLERKKGRYIVVSLYTLVVGGMLGSIIAILIAQLTAELFRICPESFLSCF